MRFLPLFEISIVFIPMEVAWMNVSINPDAKSLSKLHLPSI
jgi:hypothetical protein